MKKKISIAVTNFALPAPRRGSIDTYSGFGNAQALGLEIHQRAQAQRREQYANYQAEVATSHAFESADYLFEISGRIDGLFTGTRGRLYEGALEDPASEGGALNGAAEDRIQARNEVSPDKIEEIKSAFNIYELQRRIVENKDQHPYCLQLRTYGYFHWLKNKTVPDLRLHLVSSRNGETCDLKIELDTAAYEAWLAVRLQELEAEARLAEKRANRRRKAAGELKFPFENPRQGQNELMASIEEGIAEERPMLIQAPTGLGKTMGVLLPSLREALTRGQRTLYVTPKNSQHAVAEDAVERLQEKGANIKSMTLTAKSKMCFKNEPLCNSDHCEFAKDHYTKVADHGLIEKLAKKKLLTARSFKKMAAAYEVCPFELQLEGAIEADVIICDYNYVFAPRSVLNRAEGCELNQVGKPNLVIDEAHNLPSRAMDYYSPSLSILAFKKMRDDAEKLSPRFKNQTKSLIDEGIELIKKCAPAGGPHASKIAAPTAAFTEHDAQLRAFLSEYLDSDVEIESKDVVLRLCFYWAEFTAALEFVTEKRKEFFITFLPQPMQIKITCCDASEMLRDVYERFAHVVGFSATLKPFNYYSQLSGLDKKNLKTSEFASPFLRSRRKLLVIPQISSKYSDRERNYPRIAEAIAKIVALKPGNYFAFFPSFEFLNRVHQCFAAPPGFTTLRQVSGMGRDAVDGILSALRDQASANVVFAVQGGVFSEGVDYPGDMAIGAFVVGPPLPNFDLVREEMRRYYEDHYAAGFDYAYTYPAMAKAVQAAGRVIRSETDRGLIILMDNRFIQPSYAKSMPQDWFDADPRELVSENILHDVESFWRATQGDKDGETSARGESPQTS